MRAARLGSARPFASRVVLVGPRMMVVVVVSQSDQLKIKFFLRCLGPTVFLWTRVWVFVLLPLLQVGVFAMS